MTAAGPPLQLDGRWRTVAARSYGTRVYRVDGPREHYVKTTPPRDDGDLRFHPPGEARRLEWLRERGFPVPEVVDVGTDDRLAWLVTTALPGVPAASAWSPPERDRVLDAVADLVLALHDLPVADCPFDASLAVSLRWARRAVEQDLVDLDDLDPAHAGWSGERLLAELAASPAPAEDLVVCHGDLCLDNVLVDPDTQRVTGILDVGRLGRADRWRDLAIVLRNLAGEYPSWRPDTGLADRFLRRCGTAHDAERVRYYQLLDEFF